MFKFGYLIYFYYYSPNKINKIVSKPTVKGQVVIDYLTKFPNLPTHSLAKKIYAENKVLFTSVENCRSSIRMYRGANGKQNREKLTIKTFVKEPKEVNTYNLPESYARDYSPFLIHQERILCISDLHFPYQHNKSIELALDYGKSKKVDCILINGDLIDFATISKHEKDFRARSVNEEFESVRLFLKTLREHFPKTRIIWKFGNHDERWEKWLYLKAPEIFDVHEFKLEILLRLPELFIEVVKEKRSIKLGKLNVLHGHELPGGSGGNNPAGNTFKKVLEDTLIGDCHKTSSHSETTLNGRTIRIESQGCLCDLNPLYMPINKWGRGFSYVEVNLRTGEYYLENKRIVNNKIY